MSTYPRIAWATAMTPSSTEHYQNLLKHKVKDVVICLHLSGFKKYETGEIHTKVARETGMRIHAGLITNLANPLEDTKCFYRAYRELNYTSDAKVSIFCLKTYVVTNREKDYKSYYATYPALLTGITLMLPSTELTLLTTLIKKQSKTII